MLAKPEVKTEIVQKHMVTLDLTQPGALDVKAFDSALLGMVDKVDWDGGNMVFAQFIVIDDVMHFFPANTTDIRSLQLEKISENYPDIKLSGMQAFGYLEIEYHYDSGLTERLLGSCTNMPESGTISRESASSYMNTRFKELIEDSSGALIVLM